MFQPVLRIQIRIPRIRIFLGLLDPDPFFRGMDPDPFYHQAKVVRKFFKTVLLQVSFLLAS
jgi:hypothetical protein